MAGGPEDPWYLDVVGGLLAEAQSLALLGARTTLRSVSGVEPGPEASVRKLLGAEHEQRLQEFGLMLLGARGATTEDDAGRWSQGFLCRRVVSRSREARARSSATSSASASSGCRATPSRVVS